MFPLDFNILLVIFIAVVLFVYIFIMRKLAPERVSLKQVANESLGKTNSKSTKERKNLYKTAQGNHSPKAELPCAHEFGYLGTLPKNAKIPDECLGCSRIVRCLAEGRSHELVIEDDTRAVRGWKKK